MKTPPEPPDDFKLEPKIAFLGLPNQLEAYLKARREDWFHTALSFALAQFTLRKARVDPTLIPGAAEFVTEFLNFGTPDRPGPKPYNPLQEEK